MRSVCRLLVHSRVPINIIENYSVSRDQIDTETTGSRRKQESKDIGVLLVLIYHEPSILECSATIHPKVRQVLGQQIIFNQVQHLRHLTKN